MSERVMSNDLKDAKAEFRHRLPGCVYSISIGCHPGLPIRVRIYGPRAGFLGWFGLKRLMGEGFDQHIYAHAMFRAIDQAQPPSSGRGG